MKDLNSQKQKDLIALTKAKSPSEAKAKDFVLMWTEYHMFILSPQSTLTNNRKVIFQLPR